MSRKTKPKISPGAKLIGYARVSTRQQNLTRQMQALKAVRCDVILADKASGKSLKGRPELENALTSLAPEDCLVVAEWDRATRSMWDGLQIIQRVIDAGASIKVLDRNYIDLTTPMGRGLVAFLSAMAEDERQRIIKRTHEGRRIARANGVRMGRKPKLTEHQRDIARKRLSAGEKPGVIAEDFNVHRSTIARLTCQA